MKFLFTLTVLIGGGVPSWSAPAIPDCFKVHSLIKMDEEHYWANWTNACPYTIDSVYVMVKFADRSKAGVAQGVWALHFVEPGTHQVTRFTAPASAGDFETIHVNKITTDWIEALRDDMPHRPQITRMAANMVADPGPTVLLVPASNVEPLSVVAESMPALARPGSRLDAMKHHERGRLLLRKGDYHGAVEELSAAIQEKPDFALAYNARGFALFRLRQFVQALKDLDEAIRLNPKYMNAYQNRSRARKAAGDSTGSSADAVKARTLAKLTTD